MQPQLSQMQAQQSSSFPPKKRSQALNFGLILGLVISVIRVAYILLPYYSYPGFQYSFRDTIANFIYPLLVGRDTGWNLMNYHQAIVLSETFPIYILLLLFSLLAGILAARQTNRASTGARAGLIVGLTYTLIDTLIVSLVLNIYFGFFDYGSIMHALQMLLQGTGPYLYVVYSLVSGAILTLLSFAFGALGGLMERGRRTP